MRKAKKLHAAMSVLLAVAMTVPMVFSGNGDAIAATKKPKLSNTTLNLKVGQSKSIKVKNFTKKVTWKTSKASIAKLSAVKKTSVKVTAKKKGSAKVTATYKLGGKKKVLTCKVKVKISAPTITETPANNTSAPTATASVVNPTATPVPTEDPNATPSPTPTFSYDSYDKCLWKQDNASIKNLFDNYFLNGVSVDLGGLRYGESASLVRYHFSSITMGNENKMDGSITKENSMANVDNYYATNGNGNVIIDTKNLENALKYCKANGIKMRYHAFVWHTQVTPYFFLQDFNWSDYSEDEYAAKGWDVNNYHKLCDKETMKKRLDSYISQVIEYIYKNGYGDVIYAYDVINEATNGDGNNRHTYYYDPAKSVSSVDDLLGSSGQYKFATNGGGRTRAGGLVTSDSSAADVESMFAYEGSKPGNDSYWYSTLGPDYLYLSFYYAHEAIEKYYNQYKDQFGYKNMPSLIYNDYNQNENDHIGLAMYINAACNMLKGTTDVKFCNGIGLQSHSIGDTVQERMIKNIADKGLEVQITELDEGVSGDDQAAKLKKLYKLYMKYSKKGEYGAAQGADYIGVTSVTQWGICDGDTSSWKASYMFEKFEDESDPLLSIKPKPAFYGVLQAGGVNCGPRQY